MSQHSEDYLKFRESLGEPNGAGHHFGQFLKMKKLRACAAAEAMGTATSTVTRFVKGGSLTPYLAAKIEGTYNLSSEALFNLEAKSNTYKAKALMTEL